MNQETEIDTLRAQLAQSQAEVARLREHFKQRSITLDCVYAERDDLRARLREMTDLALAGQEAFEKLRLTTPPPPSPDAKLGEDALIQIAEKEELYAIEEKKKVAPVDTATGKFWDGYWAAAHNIAHDQKAVALTCPAAPSATERKV